MIHRQCALYERAAHFACRKWTHFPLTMCRAEAHYDDVIMGAMASQITSLTTVYLIVYSDADQRKHQSSASLAFVQGIHRGQVNSPHKWPVTRKTIPFDDVIMVPLLHSEAPAIWKSPIMWFQLHGIAHFAIASTDKVWQLPSIFKLMKMY